MSHPVLDFPVYGLAGSPDGPRWLDAVVGPLGSPATGVWLGHGSTPRDFRRAWTHVGTFRGDRFPGEAIDADQRTASSAVSAVVDATMPDPRDRSEEHGDRLLDSASTRAADRSMWKEVSWEVGSQSVSAWVLQWAGAWAAFTTALPEVDIVLVGFGLDPAGLTLTAVRGASEYHFDPDQPITFPETVEQSRTAAGVRSDATADEWWPDHPDHATAIGWEPT